MVKMQFTINQLELHYELCLHRGRQIVRSLFWEHFTDLLSFLGGYLLAEEDRDEQDQGSQVDPPGQGPATGPKEVGAGVVD